MACSAPRRSEYGSLVAGSIGTASLARAALSAGVIAAFALLYAPASYGADASRGRALYENHCQTCHTSKIHARANKLPLNKHELRLIIDDWRRQINLPWTPEEVDDVLEYLNVTRYHYSLNP
jgi:hypothetical protein